MSTTSKYEDQLLLEVESQKSWMADVLKQLMGFASTKGNETALQEAVAELCQTEIGLQVEILPIDIESLRSNPLASPVEDSNIDQFNVVARWGPNSPQGRSLILSGHVDVLQPPSYNLWTTDPYESFENNGQIIGWGGLKAGLVAMLGALKAIKSAGLSPLSEIQFQSVVEEETGGNGTVAVQESSPHYDAALVAGAAGDVIFTSQVGVAWIRINVDIPPVHASANSSNESALDIALSLREMLDSYMRERGSNSPPRYKGVDNPLSFNVGVLRSGQTPSVSPGNATMDCRMGLFPGERVENAIRAVEERIKQYADTYPILREHPPVVELLQFTAQGYELDTDDEIVKVALDAKRMAGSDAHLGPGTTATDTRTFVLSGTPAIVIGPQVQNLHSVREAVDIDDMTKRAKEIAGFISQWVGLEQA